MKRKSVLLIAVTCLLFACGEKKNDRGKEEIRKALFKDMQGLPVSLDDFKGKSILVNYWATWCVPCLKEFPSLLKAEELLSGENYVFLFPSPDTAKEMKTFYESKNYALNFLTMNQSLDQLNIYALPSTIIYTSEGEVYKKIDGATDWFSTEMIEMLRSVP